MDNCEPTYFLAITLFCIWSQWVCDIYFSRVVYYHIIILWKTIEGNNWFSTRNTGRKFVKYNPNDFGTSLESSKTLCKYIYWILLIIWVCKLQFFNQFFRRNPHLFSWEVNRHVLRSPREVASRATSWIWWRTSRACRLRRLVHWIMEIRVLFLTSVPTPDQQINLSVEPVPFVRPLWRHNKNSCELAHNILVFSWRSLFHRLCDTYILL